MHPREEVVKIRAELASALKERLPDMVVNLFTAALIWLFGALVYIPAASRITPNGLPLLCALILLIVFSIFIFKAWNGLQLLLEAASEVLAYKYLEWKKPKASLEQLRVFTKCVVSVVTILIFYVLYLPFLSALHPSLSGLVLIPIVLWIFLKVLRATTLKG